MIFCYIDCAKYDIIDSKKFLIPKFLKKSRKTKKKNEGKIIISTRYQLSTR